MLIRYFNTYIEEHKERRQIEREGVFDETMEVNFLDVLFKLQAQNGLGFQLTSTNIKAIIFVSYQINFFYTYIYFYYK